MKINKNTKIKIPCKERKYWFDRKHSWNIYNSDRMVFAVCRHCLTAFELIGVEE